MNLNSFVHLFAVIAVQLLNVQSHPHYALSSAPTVLSPCSAKVVGCDIHAELTVSHPGLIAPTSVTSLPSVYSMTEVPAKKTSTLTPCPPCPTSDLSLAPVSSEKKEPAEAAQPAASADQAPVSSSPHAAGNTPAYDNKAPLPSAPVVRQVSAPVVRQVSVPVVHQVSAPVVRQVSVPVVHQEPVASYAADPCALVSTERTAIPYAVAIPTCATAPPCVPAVSTTTTTTTTTTPAAVAAAAPCVPVDPCCSNVVVDVSTCGHAAAATPCTSLATPPTEPHAAPRPDPVQISNTDATSNTVSTASPDSSFASKTYRTPLTVYMVWIGSVFLYAL